MSTPDPNDNKPVSDELTGLDDIDQSDALKRAILKLKESGMLTHVPDDLEEMADATDLLPPALPQKPETLPETPENKAPQPDDRTIASRPKAESPTVASTDAVEKHSDERAKWAAVMSGWDDVGSIPDPNEEAAVTIPSRDALTAAKSETATQADDDWSLPVDTENAATGEQSAITIRRKEIKPQNNETALTGNREQTPWTLQQFFDGEIDLEQELLKRFPTVPAMTSVKFRTLGMNSGRKVATLSAQDGSSQIIIDADVATKVVQISFTFGSMMTLRYVLSDIPANNRERWLDLMRREKGGLAFLWNEERWREDYLICISREYSTNIFAFSPKNFESAVRITKNVTEELLDWLEDVWNDEPEPEEDDDSPLLTW